MSSQLQPSTRRLSNSCLIKHFYSSVKVINGQRQAANAIRISKYMQRHHGIKPADCIAELELCVRDGLLNFERTVGKKGSKKGALQERYVVPNKPLRDGHDWYCFECHKGGEVKCCSSCHRVFHTYCIKDLTPDNLSCYICVAQEDPISMTKEKLNRLLGYLHKSLKDMAPAKLKKWTKSEVDELAMKALLYNPVDLNTIQKKILDVRYSHWLEFAADIKNFLHNIIIYFGERSSFTQPIIKMIEYCKHDIREMEKCADCYEASNDRPDKLWFCKPCKPLHRLVFAKLEAFPFWPAKVIEQFDDKYDVRFFGSGHTRSVVHEDHVRPIPLSIKYIENLPKYGHTLSWEKAMNELIFHIICIGPRVLVTRLPANFREQNLLQKENPIPQRKRKMSDDGTRSKKIICPEVTRSNKTQNVHKSCDMPMRKLISNDKERRDDNFVDNFNCDEAQSLQVRFEQPELAKDTPNIKTPVNTIIQQAEIPEVDVPEKTDSANLTSPSETDSDSVSISELHEEIDIKDEYIEENEYQTFHIESSAISLTKVTSDKRISELDEASSSHRSVLNSSQLKASSSQLKPSSSQLKPSSSQLKPSSSQLKPSSSQLKPSSSQLKPSSSQLKPSSSQLKPSSSQFKPSSSQFKPSSSQFKPSSSQFKPSSSHHTAQQTGTHKIDVPKKKNSETRACQSRVLSDPVLFMEGITIKRIPVKEGNHHSSDSNSIVDRVQKSQSIQTSGNSAEKHSCSKDDTDTVEILAESIIVKEEPPCLHCSGRDMIPRKEAEKLKAEAVAQTTKHFLAIIARLEEQCTQKKNAEKRPGNGI